MDIKVEDANGTTVLSPAGRIDSSNARQFEEVVMKTLEAGTADMVIDLGDLSYISSAGLRVILLTAQKLKAKGKSLKLCSLSPMILEVFEVSGFSKLIPIHPDRDAALSG